MEIMNKTKMWIDKNKKKILIGVAATGTIVLTAIGVKHLMTKIPTKTIQSIGENAGGVLENAVDAIEPINVSMVTGDVVEALQNNVDAGVVLENVDIGHLGDLGAELVNKFEGVDCDSVCEVAVTATKKITE